LREHFTLEPFVGGGCTSYRGQGRSLRVEEANMLVELLGWVVLVASFIALFYALG
jgi:hypothetical protein